jgi:hypothetical protein
VWLFVMARTCHGKEYIRVNEIFVNITLSNMMTTYQRILPPHLS